MTIKVDLSAFETALKSLDAVLALPKNDVTRDSAIQRFEYTSELAWKSLRRVLFEAYQLRIEHPKEILREGARLGFISNLEEWFTYLQARNESSHAYSVDIAEKVFALIPPFAKVAHELLEKLRKQIQV